MRPRRSILTLLSAVAGVAFVALLFTPLLVKGMSPIMQGIMIGAAGILCMVGVAFGIWEARRVESRRKTKEQIWMKH